MIWQDVVITIVQVLLIVSLLPSVFGKSKPELTTSVMTGTVLAVLATTFATLDLFVASATTFGGAATWYVLAGQKYIIRKKEGRKGA